MVIAASVPGALYLVSRVDALAQWVMWNVEPFCDHRAFYSSGCGMPRYPRRSWLMPDAQEPKRDAKLSPMASQIFALARRCVKPAAISGPDGSKSNDAGAVRGWSQSGLSRALHTSRSPFCFSLCEEN